MSSVAVIAARTPDDWTKHHRTHARSGRRIAFGVLRLRLDRDHPLSFPAPIWRGRGIAQPGDLKARVALRAARAGLGPRVWALVWRTTSASLAVGIPACCNWAKAAPAPTEPNCFTSPTNPPVWMRRQMVVRLRMPVRCNTSWQVSNSGVFMTQSLGARGVTGTGCTGREALRSAPLPHLMAGKAYYLATEPRSL